MRGLSGESAVNAALESKGREDGRAAADRVFGPRMGSQLRNIEGVTPEKATALIDWLRSSAPPVVLADEMQQLFGGQRSFPWGPTEAEGATGPVPAFGPYGSAKEGR